MITIFPSSISGVFLKIRPCNIHDVFARTTDIRQGVLSYYGDIECFVGSVLTVSKNTQKYENTAIKLLRDSKP